MPLLAYTISRVAQLPTSLAIGLCIVGSCPGGTASNVVTYLAQAGKQEWALVLSISCTVVTCVPRMKARSACSRESSPSGLYYAVSLHWYSIAPRRWHDVAFPIFRSSPVTTCFLHADVPLSVAMTTASTLGAIVATPVLTKLLLGTVVPVNAQALLISTLQVRHALCVTFIYHSPLGSCTHELLVDYFHALLWDRSSKDCAPVQCVCEGL